MNELVQEDTNNYNKTKTRYLIKKGVKIDILTLV